MTIDYRSHLPHGFIEDELRGPVYRTAPDEIDDLTQIHGIGEVLEAQLNLNGVYRLEQIATWTAENIAAYSKLMPCFQDRIERNYWILQAQRIVERRVQRKRGSAVSAHGFPAGLIQTALILAIALFLGLLFVQWIDGSNPKTYAGQLKARTFVLTAQTAGKVTELLAAEGEAALEGQQVAILQDRTLEERRSQQAGLVARLQQELERARAQADLDLHWRIRELDKEILDQRRIVAMAREPGSPARSRESDDSGQLPATTAALTRPTRPLFFSPSGGATVRNSVRTASRVASTSLQIPAPLTLATAQQVRLAEQRISELERLKKSVQEDVRKASGLVATAEALQQAQKTLAELETASADLPVLADAYGIVSRILCRPHDTVEAGQPIMELVDMRTQYVTALVPSRDVGRAKPGMKVRLYFPGEQLRHGRIAALPLRTSKRNHAGDSLVEVRIEPTGSLWPTVPVGSTVEVVME